MMRPSSLPPIYVAIASVEAGIEGLGRVLAAAGLGRFFDPAAIVDELGHIRRTFFAMAPLADLKLAGVVGAEWPDEGHIRMDVVIHDDLLDGEGKSIGPHADVLISMVAPEPWTAANLPPLFSAQIAAYPVQRLAREDGDVFGRGLLETIVAVQPKSPSFHYAVTLPELPPAPIEEAPPVEVPPPEVMPPEVPPWVEEPPLVEDPPTPLDGG